MLRKSTVIKIIIDIFCFGNRVLLLLRFGWYESMEQDTRSKIKKI